MKTLKMKMTKREAGQEIAHMIKHNASWDVHYDVTIGLMDDGSVGWRHNIHGLGGIAVAVYSTESGYDGLGDINPKDWTDEDEIACGVMFADSWIDEAIDKQNDSDDWNDSIVEVVWAEDEKEVKKMPESQKRQIREMNSGEISDFQIRLQVECSMTDQEAADYLAQAFTEYTIDDFERFEAGIHGANCTCRVLDHPDLQEWEELGEIDGEAVAVYWIFDGEPKDDDFTADRIDRIEEWN